MYTLVINNNNDINTTVKTAIMQRSSLVNKLHILTPRLYNDVDMTEYTAIMEYILPVSKKYSICELVVNNENYNNNDYIEYLINGNELVSTLFTSEAGDVKLTITFYKVEMDEEGVVKQYVRKTKEGSINIIPITAWSDIVPDTNFATLDQKIIELEALAKQYAELLNGINQNVATDISLNKETETILLKNEKNEDIGTGIKVSDISEIMSKDFFGEDLDGTNDGFIHLDEVNEMNNNVKVIMI